MVRYTPKLPEKNVNVTPRSHIRELFVLLSGLIAIVVVVYFLLGLVVDQLVPYVPPSFEKKIGSVYLRQIEGIDKKDPRQPVLQAMVDDMTEKCVDLPYDVEVIVVNDQLVNAFALPGGKIVVFDGLLKAVESENELAFILGHELGHFVNKDHLRGLGRALVGLSISLTLLGTDSHLNDMLGSSLNLNRLRFSQQQEGKADIVGINSLQCRYGHVKGATDFFEGLEASSSFRQLRHYFATHPAESKRIDDIEEYRIKQGFEKKALQQLPSVFGTPDSTSTE